MDHPKYQWSLKVLTSLVASRYLLVSQNAFQSRIDCSLDHSIIYGWIVSCHAGMATRENPWDPVKNGQRPFCATFFLHALPVGSGQGTFHWMVGVWSYEYRRAGCSLEETWPESVKRIEQSTKRPCIG